MLIDIDNFKRINDEFGHVVGDEVIKSISCTLEYIFSGDGGIVGRVGGEEFAVLVPEIADRHYGELAESACKAVFSLNIDGVNRPVTISIGVAENHPSRSLKDVYAIADRALYFAKNNGKNRFIFEEMPGEFADGVA